MENLFLMKNPNFIQSHLTELQNFTHTGLLLYTESRMVYLHVMEYYLITKAREEVKHLLQEKLQDSWLEKKLV